MPAYDYLALTASGSRQRGVTEAETEQQARARLRDQGLVPLEVAASRKQLAAGAPSMLVREPRLSSDEVVLFTRLLGTLLASGLPLDDALTALSKQADSANFTRIALDIRGRVLEGLGLAAGLEQFPRSFPQVYRATVGAGAQTRHLPTVLTRLADFMAERRQVSQRLRLALIYPAVLTVVALAVVTGLLAYVVPEVVKVFAEMERELPAITRFMIATSEYVRTWGVLTAALLGLAVLGARALLRRAGVRLWCDRLLLRTPLVRSFIRESDAGRFARTLAILLSSGSSMIEALKIAAGAVVNHATRAELATAIERVREGSALNTALRGVNGFPPLLAHLTASGETAGELPRMLDTAAAAHEASMQTRLALMLSLAEPALILAMGAVVLAIVLAILLPIFDMNQMV